MKAIIIDDEKKAIDALQDVLANIEQVEVVETFINPVRALERMREFTCDVVFLDMEMPGIHGLEMAEKILEQDLAHHVVFITAYDQYAVEAFEVNAIDYLLKPVRFTRMMKTVEKLLESAKVMKQPESQSSTEGRVTCFGVFQLLCTSEQKEQIKWRTNKAKELFAYLVHYRGKSVNKEKMIEDIWPDMEVERAINYLHTSIYQIRKTIKHHSLDHQLKVNYSHESYCLVMDGISSDIDEFLTRAANMTEITQGNIQLYENAASLYRDHYFEENDYPWAVGFKQQLFLYYIKMVKAMASYYMYTGMYTEAVLQLKQLLAMSPLQEECHDLLLTCYAEMGNRAALDEHFAAMNLLYNEELGMDVKPTTKKLYEELHDRLSR